MESKERVAQLLDRLADGEGVELGEFGDAGSTTDADEDAALIRELADSLRR